MKIKLHFWLTGLLLFAVLRSYCQNKTLTGRVVDQLNQPIRGAVISVLHERKYTLSKEDGSFTIDPADLAADTLQVTNVGYRPQLVAINGRTSIQVQLMQDSKDLNDVVVISALGLTKKLNSVTYSQQSVNVDQMTEARDINITNMLAGKVAGLQVTNTGQPGSSTRVVIRGPKSATGNNQPLWVVDGVPIANNPGDDRGDNLDYGNGAQDLNPDDIASIEVLEGPNAAALYGSQAANGAILVTTKRGDALNKNWGINVNENLMLYTVTAFPNYQNIYGEGSGGRLVTNTNQLIGNTGAIRMGTNGQSWGAPMLGQPYLLFNDSMSSYSPQPNNVSDLYQNALTNTSNISLSKADALTSFRLSYTYTKGNDVLPNQNLMQRHNVNLYVTRKVNSHLTIDTRMLYTRTDFKNRTYRNLDPSSPMSLYVYLPRSAQLGGFKPWVDPVTGNAVNFGTFSSNTENPYWSIYENKNEDISDRLIGGISATLALTNYLSFRTQATIDYNYESAFQYKELGGIKTPNGYYWDQDVTNQNWNYEGLFMFNKNLTKDISLVANLGGNYANSVGSRNAQSVNQLLVHDMPSISNANAVPVLTEARSHTRIMSVYGSATLGYKNFIYLDMTGRNDWSSTLPIDNDSYFYPSIGASFVFSNLLKNKDILSYGKLRASYAGVGNGAGFAALYNTFSNSGLFNGTPTLVYGTQLKNYNLKPEKTDSKEIGVDLGFLKDQRINLTASIYKSNTYNQIITAQSLPETGFTSRIINAGNIQNKGIELTLNANVIQTKDFTWNLTANWSKNENMVVSLAKGVDQITLGQNLGATVLAMKGKPYAEIVGNVPYMVGDTMIVQANGRMYYDQNQPVGNSQPDWLGSFGSTFRYKNFDLSVLFTFKWGGSIYSASYGNADRNGVSLESLQGRDAYFFSSQILGENDNERKGIEQVGNTNYTYNDSRVKGTRYPLSYYAKTDASGNIVYDANGRMEPGAPNLWWLDPNVVANDYFNDAPLITFDATSIRLSQLIFGYTFPQKWIKNTFIKGVRLAFTGRNLWQIVQHTPHGIDPESANTSGNAQGIEAGGSFPYAQYGFDFKMNF